MAPSVRLVRQQVQQQQLPMAPVRRSVPATAPFPLTPATPECNGASPSPFRTRGCPRAGAAGAPAARRRGHGYPAAPTQRPPCRTAAGQQGAASLIIVIIPRRTVCCRGFCHAGDTMLNGCGAAGASQAHNLSSHVVRVAAKPWTPCRTAAGKGERRVVSVRLPQRSKVTAHTMDPTPHHLQRIKKGQRFWGEAGRRVYGKLRMCGGTDPGKARQGKRRKRRGQARDTGCW